jgi:hypothetical protein
MTKISAVSFFAAVLTIGFTTGCAKMQKIDTLPVYLHWLNKAENGLVKIRYINGIELKAKFLPAEYRAYNELNGSSEYTARQKDSIMEIYKNSICIMLTIGPDERERKGGDIMTRSVATYKEYASRVNDMNFKMEEYIKLKAGAEEFRPVLSSMENVYGLDVGRNILLVFVPDKKGPNPLLSAENLDFVYADELFDLGTNHFLFSRKDIDQIPAFTFWNQH